MPYGSGVVYECTKCVWRTSGTIFDRSQMDRRECLKCHSPLVRCNHCHRDVSATRMSDGRIVCDECHEPISSGALAV